MQTFKPGVPSGAQGALENLWVGVPRAPGSTQAPLWGCRALGVGPEAWEWGYTEPLASLEGYKSIQGPRKP